MEEGSDTTNSWTAAHSPSKLWLIEVWDGMMTRAWVLMEGSVSSVERRCTHAHEVKGNSEWTGPEGRRESLFPRRRNQLESWWEWKKEIEDKFGSGGLAFVCVQT